MNGLFTSFNARQGNKHIGQASREDSLPNHQKAYLDNIPYPSQFQAHCLLIYLLVYSFQNESDNILSLKIRLILHGAGQESGHGTSMEKITGTPSRPITEKLLAALLCRDSGLLGQTFNDGLKFNDFADELVFQIGESGLAGLFYERAYELETKGLFGQIGLSGGLNFFEYLEKQAMQAAIKANQMDERFFELRHFLEDELDQLIWLKSTVLVRTLYTKLNYRVGIDFDVVVSEGSLPQLLKRLSQSGWRPLLKDPGFCHQVGVGPTNNLASLFLVPQEELEGCHNLTMEAPGWPHLELKFNPLDNGVKMKELDRFFDQAVDVSWRGSTFKAPELVDHLIVELVHLHKHRLFGFGWMHDIHLLCNKLNENPSQWAELTTRCRSEGVRTSAGAALLRVQGLLKTNIPNDVLSELGSGGILARSLVNSVSTEFIWNANSLPMLVLNAAVMGDGRRKMRILERSFLPNDTFLSSYYLNGKPVTMWNRIRSLVLHWLVLIMPAGIIRHTFGKTYWANEEQFG